MDLKLLSSIEHKKLLIHETVTKLALAKHGMALPPMQSEREDKNLLLPLLNNAMAAFFCQISVASSSSF